MADPTLIAAKRLRAYEEAHPWQAIAGGFTPGIGQASAAAALRDPDAPWWEKALNAPGLVPGLAGASKAMVIGVKLAKGNPALEASLEAAKNIARKLRAEASGQTVSKGPIGTKSLLEGDPRINDRLARETGWWIDPDTGKWMHELDDSTSMPDIPYMLGAVRARDRLAQSGRFGTPPDTIELGSLEDVLSHPELGKLPEAVQLMRDLRVKNLRTGTPGNASFRPSTGEITFEGDITPSNLSGIRDSLLHEPQHGIAGAEGFSRGTSDVAAGSYEAYLRDPGELLAWVTAARRNMSPAARKKYPFHRQLEDERIRLMDPAEARYGPSLETTKRGLALRNFDPEEMLVPGP